MVGTRGRRNGQMTPVWGQETGERGQSRGRASVSDEMARQQEMVSSRDPAAPGNDATCKGETHTTGFGSAIAAVLHSIHSTHLATASEDPFLLGWLKNGIKTGKLNLSGENVQKKKSIIN